MAGDNRYAKDWDDYSRWWERELAGKHRHLGDEWNDDATAERKRDEFYFNIFAEPYLYPGMTVLEIGPGGGKWTVRLAPRVKKVICLDVSEEMLKRTETRCRDEGVSNVELILGDGKDFRPVGDDSVGYFFSYDVFVHIMLEDTFAYVQEMNRVLAPGGRGACHHAVNDVATAWNRVESMNAWYRGGRHTTGQFYYHSPESLQRMYEHCGLGMLGQYQEGWHCTCLFTKPNGSVVPKLERLLARLSGDDCADPGRRAETIAALRGLPGELSLALEAVLKDAEGVDDQEQRAQVAAGVRQAWRGILRKG